MALKGYHSYRGRQGSWRGPVTLLLVLILLAAGAFLFLQRYVIFSDDGSFRLDLPVFDRLGIGEEKPVETGRSPEPDLNLVVEEIPPETEREPVEPQPEDEPAPPVDTPRRLVGLSTLPADEAQLLAVLENFGADGFVFTAKADRGEIRYASVEAPPEFIGGDAAAAETLAALCAAEEVYTVAKINCFHDTDYAFANMEAAGICQKNGYIWYDFSENHWLDPEKEAARAYVITLALECAQMGFDEILLEDMCYPPSGKLHKIDYSHNEMEKTEALALFLDELRQELEPYGVRVSLLLDEAEILGTADDSDVTGFAAQRLLPLVDCVYAVTADREAAELGMSALLGGEAVPVLIPIVADETAVGGWYLPQ